MVFLRESLEHKKQLKCCAQVSVEGDELVRVGRQISDGDAALLPYELGHALQLLSRKKGQNLKGYLPIKRTVSGDFFPSFFPSKISF